MKTTMARPRNSYFNATVVKYDDMGDSSIVSAGGMCRFAVTRRRSVCVGLLGDPFHVRNNILNELY